MFLERIILTHFKNYSSQELECSPGLNCIVGQNGMGKTNILDAIYYLSMGKSHFGGSDRNILQHGAEFFRLEGHFSFPDSKQKVVAKVIPGKRKEFERNDKAYKKLSEHIGRLPLVFIAPDDTQIAHEGSEYRRRFMDNTLSQTDTDYLKHLLVYGKLLKQRNALLKQFGESRTFDPALLSVIDQQMEAPASYIFKSRKTFLDKFNPLLGKTHFIISGKKEKASCRYKSELKELKLAEILKERQEKDRILQRTTGGIHRDDMEFFLDGYSLKRFASQGQLKSFVLSLKLAQFELIKEEKEMAPILLLDDIFDKLDKQRVKQLLGLLIQGSFDQIFITDTDENRVSEIIKSYGTSFKKFFVKEGAATLVKIK